MIKYEQGPELDRFIFDKFLHGDHHWVRAGEDLVHYCTWCGGQFRVDALVQPMG